MENTHNSPMEPHTDIISANNRLYKYALALAIFTISYNIIEGLVSIWFGYADESLALLGFGIDSIVEVISGIGITHMIIRIWNHPESDRDDFERVALRITGISFYLLTLGLAASALFNIVTGHKPETTFWGVIISLISIFIMLLLATGKIRIGNRLKSEAILADAECTKVCIYMSVILLVSSGIFELTGFRYIDSIGTLGLAYFSFTEGRECFIKIKNKLNNPLVQN